MRAPSSLVSTFLVALSLSPQWTVANPIATSEPAIEEIEEIHNVTLVERACAGTVCGWNGQLCCESGESCYTDSNNQAQCGAATATTGDGSWTYWTSTWVDTETMTSVYSSYAGTVTGSAGSGVSCDQDKGESSCGSICCASDQYCQLDGQCAAVGVSESPGVSPTGTGASYSAPVRPTSGTLITVTATAGASTVPFETPVATGATAPVSAGEGGSSGGLSGGAIAGIVIGVLAGIFLLALLCLFCCAKAAWDGLLAIFGLGGKKKRHSTEYVEEYHRHSAGGGSRHSGWYGDRPARPPPPPKKSGGGLGLGGLLAGLGGAAALFGLSKKKRESRYDDKTTTTGYSDYYYSDYTSSSK